MGEVCWGESVWFGWWLGRSRDALKRGWLGVVCGLASVCLRRRGSLPRRNAFDLWVGVIQDRPISPPTRLPHSGSRPNTFGSTLNLCALLCEESYLGRRSTKVTSRVGGDSSSFASLPCCWQPPPLALRYVHGYSAWEGSVIAWFSLSDLFLLLIVVGGVLVRLLLRRSRQRI